MEYYEIVLKIPVVDWIKVLQWYFWGSILSMLGILYMNVKHTIRGTYNTKGYSLRFEILVFLVILVAYPLIWIAFLVDR